jgi:hypothetical protein
MRIKRKDLNTLIESLLLNEAVSDPNDPRWNIIRLALVMIDTKKSAAFKDSIKDSWGTEDDTLWAKITSNKPIPDDITKAGEPIKQLLINLKLPGNKTGQKRYDELVGMLASKENTAKAIAFQKGQKGETDTQTKGSAKKSEDVSDQVGKIVQDPGAAGYHYKKIDDKHYIISSPKDKKVSEKNATFVDTQSMKDAFDAISKLF